jgi:hypothetical protein
MSKSRKHKKKKQNNKEILPSDVTKDINSLIEIIGDISNIDINSNTDKMIKNIDKKMNVINKRMKKKYKDYWPDEKNIKKDLGL